MVSLNLNLAAESEPDVSTIFHRRIEFHLARKPFNGFSNNYSNGFKLVTLNPDSKNGFHSESRKELLLGKRGERLELLETGFDSELNLGITFRRIGAGLRNLGNTCFLNSVLQCLTYTEPLAAYLQSGKHQTSCRTAGFCALCAIQKHVSRALLSTGRTLEPKDLVSNLRCISRNFRNARQEDAHEYMVNLLECMHKCCLPSGVPSESPIAYGKSLVHKIFGGCLRSQVKCLQCSFCSDKFDPFLDLSLEIMKADSLYKAFAHFTAKEQLDGGARQYQCEQCKQKVKALKQLTIHKAPHVLTIHLKRFGSHVAGQKIDKKVEFGPTVDLKPFVTGPYDGDLKYTLYGVLVHAGWSTHSGHYYCFVRTSSGMWYSLDDNQVFQVNERKVLQQKAYMLFYVRDRRNFASKKPAAVMQKENMVINALGKVEITKNVADSLGTNRPKKMPNKDTPSQRVNGSIGVECLSLNVDLLPKSLSAAPSTNVSVKGLSIVNTNAGNHPADTVSSVINNVGSCLQKHLKESVMGPSDCHGPQGSINKKEMSDSITVPSSCNQETSGNGDLGYPINKSSNSSVSVLSEENLCNRNDTKSEMYDGKAMTLETTDKASRKTSHLKTSQQIDIKDSQVGGSLMKGCDAVTLEAHDNGQRAIGDESESLSGLPVITASLSTKKENRKKCLLKVKGRPFKRQVANMQLSSNILFGAAFRLNKKRKPVSKGNKNACLESLGGEKDLSPSVVGPSTSGQSFPVSFGSTFSMRVDCGSNDKETKFSVQNSDNGNVFGGVSTEVFIEKVGQSEAMDSNNQQQHKGLHSTSYVKQSIAGRPNCSGDKRPKLTQSAAVKMLSTGLDEMTVAHWDDIEIPSSYSTESRGQNNVRIGYIGDEWDEEYDQGRRKKLRHSKMNFSGPNPFQEISNRSAERKKAKMDSISSRNQPFRI